MSHFDLAIDQILKNEGGYSFDLNDPGGETNFGITQKLYNNYYEILDFPPSVKDLTIEEAKKFYLNAFWEKYNYEQINSPILATKIFDMAVNLGPKEAHKIVQECCTYFGYLLSTDGILGPASIMALNEISLHIPKINFLNKIIENQKNYYERIIQINPTLEIFRHGWIHRAEWLPTDNPTTSMAS